MHLGEVSLGLGSLVLLLVLGLTGAGFGSVLGRLHSRHNHQAQVQHLKTRLGRTARMSSLLLPDVHADMQIFNGPRSLDIYQFLRPMIVISWTMPTYHKYYTCACIPHEQDFFSYAPHFMQIPAKEVIMHGLKLSHF